MSRAARRVGAAAVEATTRAARRRVLPAVAGALLLALLAAAWATAGPATPAPSAHAGDQAPRASADRAAQRAALRRALALVTYDGRLGFRLMLAARRPSVRAEADTRRRTITVYLDPADAPHRVAHDIAHELGHAWDARYLDDAGRRAYLRGRGAAGRAWWPDSRTADYDTGAGDFAEVFARCHAASPEFRSRLAPAPADACAALPAAAGGRW
jgi:hypothetical protein